MQQEIRDTLQIGFIEESYSYYCTPWIVVKKKGNSLRLCIDFRHLNSVIKVDPVPMLNADGFLSQVAEAKFFSKLDLTKVYYQTPTEDRSKQYAAFATPEGLYHFKEIPFWHF